MYKNTLLLIAILMLSGCHHLTLNGFDRSPYSGISENKVGIIIENDMLNKSKDVPINNSLLTNTELRDAIENTCVISEQKFAPELIPIVAAFGKMIFDYQIDKNTKNLEKLKKAAVSSYSQRVLLSSEEFKRKTCAVIYRYDPQDKSVGFISVLKINNHGEAFSLTPTYVKANNTVAITKKSAKKTEAAKINASIAVSVKAIGSEVNKLPSLKSIGEGVVTIPNIDVGPDGHIECNNKCGSGICESSDLVPYVLTDNRSISVTFSITETGKLGVDLDEKISEAQAIKEAIGPALKESIQKYLTDDD